MAPPSQELEPPINPERFMDAIEDQLEQSSDCLVATVVSLGALR
jgi:hypothetical protein